MTATLTVTVSTGFQASSYQRAIFDFITDGKGDGLVNAVAGSGKTTTLVQAARLLRTDRAAFFAFNKHIADELNARLVGTPMRASTIHSFGFRMLGDRFGRMTVKEDKYRAEAERYIDANLSWDERGTLAGHGGEEARERLKDQLDARRDGLVKLIDFARMSMVRPDNAAGLRALIAQYQIEVPGPEDEDYIVRGARPIMERGADMIRQRVIDFTDMVWGPVFLGVPVEKFHWVFTDEAQDLNTAQRYLVLATRAPGGRMIFVGDVNQAIFSFAGADARSFWAIREETGATLLPLSVCYRCPSSHLDLARTLVPHIEARPGAPEGTVLAIHEDKILENVREGMMILCRTTAPLVSLCIRLIRHRIPARVRGRDVAKGLMDMARKVGKRLPYREFPMALVAYEAAQIERLADSPNSESRIVALQDKVAALQACYEEFTTIDTIADLCQEIDGIFHDGRASVILSTIHRAKGLDTDDVMILHPELLPFMHPKQTPEQQAQERNIYYVGLTRAKQALIFAYPDSETLPATALGNVNLD